MWSIKMGRTSVAPIHGCPVDRRSLSLATGRCSESERHAALGQLYEGGKSKERTLQMPQAALHSSVDADTWFA